LTKVKSERGGLFALEGEKKGKKKSLELTNHKKNV